MQTRASSKYKTVFIINSAIQTKSIQFYMFRKGFLYEAELQNVFNNNRQLILYYYLFPKSRNARFREIVIVNNGFVFLFSIENIINNNV